MFGQSYLANCVSANGKAAFLGEAASHNAVHHFQGLERFREPDLPRRLPLREVDIIEEEESIIALKKRISELSAASEPDQVACKAAVQELHNKRRQLKARRLKKFQKTWKAQRDKEKITSRGTGPRPSAQHASTHILIELLPERRRLAELVTMDGPMSLAQMQQASLDLYSLCTRDYSVLYRPQEEPTEKGLCPVCNAHVDK